MEFAQHLHDDVQIGQDGEGNFNTKRLETSATRIFCKTEEDITKETEDDSSEDQTTAQTERKVGFAVAAKRKTTSYPPKRDRRS